MGVRAAHGPVNISVQFSLRGKESILKTSLRITKNKLGEPAGHSQYHRQAVHYGKSRFEITPGTFLPPDAACGINEMLFILCKKVRNFLAEHMLCVCAVI